VAQPCFPFWARRLIVEEAAADEEVTCRRVHTGSALTNDLHLVGLGASELGSFVSFET
jgi:hypothetical protein